MIRSKEHGNFNKKEKEKMESILTQTTDKTEPSSSIDEPILPECSPKEPSLNARFLIDRMNIDQEYKTLLYENGITNLEELLNVSNLWSLKGMTHSAYEQISWARDFFNMDKNFSTAALEVPETKISSFDNLGEINNYFIVDSMNIDPDCIMLLHQNGIENLAELLEIENLWSLKGMTISSYKQISWARDFFDMRPKSVEKSLPKTTKPAKVKGKSLTSKSHN